VGWAVYRWLATSPKDQPNDGQLIAYGVVKNCKAGFFSWKFIIKEWKELVNWKETE
jgi:hypothetical protein